MKGPFRSYVAGVRDIAATEAVTVILKEQLMEPQTAERLGILAYDSADYLTSADDCVLYLQACLQEAPEDAAFIARAIGTVARARGMMQLSRDTGISREGLYKALGDQANPTFATVLKVLHALGLQMDVRPASG